MQRESFIIFRRKSHFTVLLLTFFLVPSLCSAQVATGTAPFSALSGGAVDSINLSNLNIHVSIPIFGKPGRGIAFAYTLSFDNSIWSPVNTSLGVNSWQPVLGWGWRGTSEAFTGYVTYVLNGQFTCTNSALGQTTEYSDFVYHDPSGNQHSADNMVDTTGCLAGTHTTGTTSDGYKINASISGGVISGSVQTPSGAVIVPPFQYLPNYTPLLPPVGNGTLQDTNGNQISMNASGSTVTFIDTLGTPALVIDNSNPNAVKYNYTGPDGNTASITATYTQYTVQTNFGALDAGGHLITEYPPSTVALISSISFPDSSSYSFTYETTPGNAPAITGRLASIQLPNGGIISYTYTGGANGIAADGTTTGIIRTVDSHEWRYTRVIPSSGPSTTTVTADNNDTVYIFAGEHELQRQVYQGSSQSGALLAGQLTCYNGATSNCATVSRVNTPITQVDVYDQLPGGLEALTETQYDSSGNPTQKLEFDYGTAAPGSLVRKVVTSYASLGNNITGKPHSVTVYDGSGKIASQAIFGYDEATPTPTSEAQHIAVTGSRGNVTSIQQLTATNASLHKSFSYYDTGALNIYTDVNGAVTTYNYGSGSCNNSYPTSVSLPLNLTLSTAWDCTGGVITSSSDENQQSFTYVYNTADDPSIWRTKRQTDPLGNMRSRVYGIATIEDIFNFNGGNSTADVLVTLDSYGRPSTAQVRRAPSATSFDTIEMDYDALGRQNRVTANYIGAAGQTNANIAGAVTTYDALSRVTRRTESGGNYVSYSYLGNDILAQQGPAPAGESLKQKQFEYDALGRLTSVCEITTLPGSGECGQNTPATGFVTRYTYDALDNILAVTQNAQSSSPQTRQFTYDFVSRKTSVTTPESGIITYIYDSDPNGVCQNSNPGDIVRRVDNAGISTCYAYDARRRMISATSSGLGAINVDGVEQSKVVATPGSGTITVSGTEQSVPGAPAVAGSGSVTIQGGERSKVDTSDCNLVNHIWVCTTIYDYGTVTLTMNGTPGVCSYGRNLNTTSGVMAGCLANAITNAGGSPVTASASGSTINMQARSGGYSTNYSFSVSSSYDSADFSGSGPAYTGAPSSGNLTGGADAGPTNYDVGTVSVTVGAFTARASYGQNDSPSSIASLLVNDPNTGLNIASSPVTATYSNNVVSVTAKDTGTYAVSTASSSSAGFSPPSFSASPSVSSLSPGSQISYDTGNVSITVGTSVASVAYGQNDTATTVANNLAATINSSQAFPATASVIYPTRVELIAKQAGSYSISASSSSTNNLFSGASFTTQASATSGIDSSRQTRFVYDNATVNGQTMVNVRGRLAEALTCIADCTGSNIITDLGFSYDAAGNVTDAYESTPHSGGYYHVRASYWPNDRLHTLGGLPGIPVFSFDLDSEGRISTISAGSGQNPVTATSFDAGGHVTSVTLGSGDSDTYSIDPNTGRMTQFQASVGSNILTGAITWNTNDSIASLQITDPFNTASNQTCTYSYDDLGRLAAVNCGSAWSQTFSYDPFGNISKSGSSSYQPIYSAASNRIQSLPGFTPTYNANGALLNDGVHTYAWDAEGNVSSVDSVGLVYDAMGRMVEQARGAAYTQIVYSPTGDKLALMSGQTLQKAFLELPGGGAAVYNASGLAYYRHPDWLGSSRLASTPTQTVYSDTSYAPFGESYGTFGSADLSFTHEQQDTVSGLYDFLYREYSPAAGRWISCDPVGSWVGNPADPQSWNAYSFTLNNPTNLIDPNGFEDKPPCKDLIQMGITDTSTLDKKDKNDEMRQVEELAALYGYNIDFPYSNMNKISSIWDVFRQGQGATTAATKSSMDAIQYTMAQGGTTVINISGASQAYASAMANMPGASGTIQSVIYLSPGMGGSQLVRGTNSTDRYSAHGFWDGIVNATATAEAGTVTDRGKLNCSKHSAVCELEDFLNQKCQGACKHADCQSKIFSRNVAGPRDNPNGPPPPPAPGYHIGTWCTYGPEGPECYDYIYWDWGWLGSNVNPGGGCWDCWPPKFW